MGADFFGGSVGKSLSNQHSTRAAGGFYGLEELERAETKIPSFSMFLLTQCITSIVSAPLCPRDNSFAFFKPIECS